MFKPQNAKKHTLTATLVASWSFALALGALSLTPGLANAGLQPASPPFDIERTHEPLADQPPTPIASDTPCLEFLGEGKGHKTTSEEPMVLAGGLPFHCLSWSTCDCAIRCSKAHTTCLKAAGNNGRSVKRCFQRLMRCQEKCMNQKSDTRSGRHPRLER